MSEINLLCSHCRKELQCSETHRGARVECPHCGETIEVASAPRSFIASMPTRTRKPGFGTTEGGWLIKLGIAALGVGLLSALLLPIMGSFPPETSTLGLGIGAFLVGAGAVLVVVTGLMILFNAFRDSLWWGLGFFVPFFGGIVSLVYVFKHWSRNGILFLANLGGTVLAIIGIFTAGAGIIGNLEGMAEFQEPGSSSAVITAGGSTPGETFTSFQTAVREKNHAQAFAHLTTHFQNTLLNGYIQGCLNLRLSQRMGTLGKSFEAWPQEAKDDIRRNISLLEKQAKDGETVLARHGFAFNKYDQDFPTSRDKLRDLQATLAKQGAPASAQRSLVADYAPNADKARLYQDLAQLKDQYYKDLRDLFPSGLEMARLETDLGSSPPLTEVTTSGSTATGKTRLKGSLATIRFTQEGDLWKITGVDLDRSGAFAALAEQLAERFAKPGETEGRSDSTPPAVEDRVVAFQRHNALSGNRTAQYDLGMRYLRGDGVERDDEQAKHWLKLAAEQGETRASRALAQLSQAEN